MCMVIVMVWCGMVSCGFELFIRFGSYLLILDGIFMLWIGIMFI